MTEESSYVGDQTGDLADPPPPPPPPAPTRPSLSPSPSPPPPLEYSDLKNQILEVPRQYDRDESLGDPALYAKLWRVICQVCDLLAFWKRSQEDVIVPKLEDFPPGYPQLAAWIESDPNFVEYRRYMWLRHRCLLYMQDELAGLERQLQYIDQVKATDNPRLLKSRDLDVSRRKHDRPDVLEVIKNKLEEYDRMLFKVKDLMQWKKPSSRNRQSYVNFISSERPPLSDEADFIKYKEDLGALGGELEDDGLNAFVETALYKSSKRGSQFLFRSRTQKNRTDNKHAAYYDKRKLDMLVRSIVTIICATFLMAPVILLYVLQPSGSAKDTVILLFTTLFAMFLALFTKAKRHELFAATAGYCAVLVVFLANSSIYLSTPLGLEQVNRSSNNTLRIANRSVPSLPEVLRFLTFRET